MSAIGWDPRMSCPELRGVWIGDCGFSARVWLGANVYFNALIRSETNEAERVSQMVSMSLGCAPALPSSWPKRKSTIKPLFSRLSQFLGVIGKFCFFVFLIYARCSAALAFFFFFYFTRLRKKSSSLSELPTQAGVRMKSNERRVHKAKKCHVNWAKGGILQFLAAALLFCFILCHIPAYTIRSKFVCKQIRDWEFRQPFSLLFLLVHTICEESMHWFEIILY